MIIFIILITNSDCNYFFPVDLAPNGILFGAESIQKRNSLARNDDEQSDIK